METGPNLEVQDRVCLSQKRALLHGKRVLFEIKPKGMHQMSGPLTTGKHHFVQPVTKNVYIYTCKKYYPVATVCYARWPSTYIRYFSNHCVAVKLQVIVILVAKHMYIDVRRKTVHSSHQACTVHIHCTYTLCAHNTSMAPRVTS